MESLGQALKSTLPGALSCDLSPQEAQRELCKRRTQEFNAAAGDLNSTSLGGVDCPECHNKGVIMANRQTESGLWETRVRECKCMTTRRSIRRLVRSGLKDVTKTYTFHCYEAEKPWQKRLKEAAMGLCRTSALAALGGYTWADRVDAGKRTSALPWQCSCSRTAWGCATWSGETSCASSRL